MKKIFFPIVFILSFVSTIILTTNPTLAGPLCDALGGTCKQNCAVDTESNEGNQDCGKGAKGQAILCCVPEELTEPVACPGECKSSCDTGEVKFFDYNNCDVQGLVCCNKNPLADPVTDINVFCNDNNSLDTAIGCIPITDTTSFISFILRWAIGVGGGIAFLLIVYAGFMIMTSTGNPDRLKAGQELLTSAIMGLILLIFSVFILRVIGVDILKIPGFGQ